MTTIEFLNELKNNNTKLAYALTDGYEVVIYDVNDLDKNIFETDIHTILHELMHSYGLEDRSV